MGGNELAELMAWMRARLHRYCARAASGPFGK